MLHYYVFYKPYNVLTQFSASGDKETLAAYLKDIPKDVYPAGRLDYDSEGLLLLTNDKVLIHRMLTPSFEHERTYWVQVEGSITTEAIVRLQKGVNINLNGKQYATKPAVVKLLPGVPVVPERYPPVRFRKSIPTSWITLTLTEGKNRQVRRMTAAVGFPTLRLIRYSIGRVTIEGMAPAEYRPLSSKEKQQLLYKSK